MLSKRLVSIAVPQRLGHILAHQPGLPVEFDGAHRPKLLVLKNLHFLHNLRPPPPASMGYVSSSVSVL